METWQTILVAIGGNTAVVAVLAFLGKTFVDKIVQRDAKQFEMELQHKFDSAIERLKNALEIKATEHQVSFSKLHERRAETIADLYGKAVDLELAVSDFLRKYAGSDETKRRKRLENLWSVAKVFREYYSRRKVYFRESTCRAIDGYYKSLSDASSNLALFQQYPEVFDTTNEQSVNEWIKAMQMLSGQIPPIKAALEEDFRDILGVERGISLQRTTAS
jgi:hypothetical protein